MLLDIRGFPGGVVSERRKWQKLKRRKVHSLVLGFKNAIEARAIDAFWISRKQGKLRKRPEKIAQSLFAVFAMGVIGQTGCLLREVASGIGYVDVGVIFSRTLHLIEMKVLRDALVGPDQLEQYMQKEKRREGFLVLVDTIPPHKKKILPTTIKTPSGLIRVVVVDANPTPPSRK